MTPAQKVIVRQKKVIDSAFYKNLIHWFKAHHPGFRYKDLDPPEIHLVEDDETHHNTDNEGDPQIETRCEEGVFYFTSGNSPRRDTSVYKTTRELALAILDNRSAPRREICISQRVKQIQKYASRAISIREWLANRTPSDSHI